MFERVVAIGVPGPEGRALVELASVWASLAEVELDVVDAARLRARARSAVELVVLPDPALGPALARLGRWAHRWLPGPLLFAKGHRGGRGVLAATDLTDPRWPALAGGHAVARAFELALSTVHVVSAIGELAWSTLPITPFSVGSGWAPPFPSERDARRALAEAHEALGLRARPHVAPGEPRRTILDVASTIAAQLVVVGSHKRRGLERWLLGSVSEDVVARAACPVLVVPLASQPTSDQRGAAAKAAWIKPTWE